MVLGEVNSLKDENDSLKCQIEAYKNEVDVIKQENLAELEQKTKHMNMLQQTLKGMQEVTILASFNIETMSTSLSVDRQ